MRYKLIFVPLEKKIIYTIEYRIYIACSFQ